MQELTFDPVADNMTLVSDPAARRMAGDIANVPVMGGTNAQEGRVFTVGLDNTTAFLETYIGDNPTVIKAIEAAYPLGQDGIETAYDQISQIYTEDCFSVSSSSVGQFDCSGWDSGVEILFQCLFR